MTSADRWWVAGWAMNVVLACGQVTWFSYALTAFCVIAFIVQDMREE